MFLKSWVQMGGFELNHHWHGINVLSLLECCLLAAVLCSIVPLAFRAVRRSKRLTAMALAGTMLFATAAYAANTALSNLTASGALAGANLIYVVQTAGTGGVKATMTQVATFINSLFSGDFTCTSGGSCTVTKINGVTPPSPIGSVTSVAAGCGTTTSPAPIVATGTVAAAMTTRANTATTDAILSADCGNRVTESNASAVAVTLPVATTTGFTSGYFFDIVNLGAGTVTITPTTSTINGSATLTLAQGQGASISSDGTNYSANLGKGGSGSPTGAAGGGLAGTYPNPTVATVPASAMPALTGDCVTTAGAVAVTCPTLLPQYPYVAVSNLYFSTPGIGNTSATVLTVNRLYMIPVYLPANYAATTIAVSVTTGQPGGSGFLGLYSACFNTSQAGCATAAFGQPNALLASGGTTPVALATSTQTPTQTISFTTTYSGLYYLALVATASSTMPSVITISTIGGTFNGMTLSAGGGSPQQCLFRSFTFPTQLNTAEAGNTFSAASGVNCPVLGIK